MQDRETELRPLMIAACNGNQQAYVALLSDMAKLLRGFFRKRMLSVPDDVEDVVQEVLIAIHNQRHTYDAGQPVTAWVHGIARYKLADFYRRRGAQGGEHLDIDDAAEWLTGEDHEEDAIRRLEAARHLAPADPRPLLELTSVYPRLQMRFQARRACLSPAISNMTCRRRPPTAPPSRN